MSNPYGLPEAQMERLKPFPPESHGRPRGQDRRVPSGVFLLDRNGLSWRDAPGACGLSKTLCCRWRRSGDNGVLARIMPVLAAESAGHRTIVIDATCLETHRTALGLRVKRRMRSPDRAQVQGPETVRGIAVPEMERRRPLPGGGLQSGVPRGTELHAVADAGWRLIAVFMPAGQAAEGGRLLADRVHVPETLLHISVGGIHIGNPQG